MHAHAHDRMEERGRAARVPRGMSSPPGASEPDMTTTALLFSRRNEILRFVIPREVKKKDYGNNSGTLLIEASRACPAKLKRRRGRATVMWSKASEGMLDAVV